MKLKDHKVQVKFIKIQGGNVRIDSFNGDARNPDNHDRFTLNTRNGGNVSGHGYNHEDKFDTSKGKNK